MNNKNIEQKQSNVNRTTNTKCCVISLNTSEEKGQKKTPVKSINLITEKGVENDAHFGSKRQLSLLPIESVNRMIEDGLDVVPGSFAENITISGLLASDIQIGAQYSVGESLIEITEIGKDCHAPCAIYKQAGYCVMPEDGIFARIIKGGKVNIGDDVNIANKPSLSNLAADNAQRNNL